MSRRRRGCPVATVSARSARRTWSNQVTRERVLAVATELGYRPSPAARSLITGRTANIGIVVPDLGNPFFTGVLQERPGAGPRGRLRGPGRRLGRGPGRGRGTRPDDAKQVDGVLLCSPGIKDGLITTLAENQPLTLLQPADPRHRPRP